MKLIVSLVLTVIFLSNSPVSVALTLEELEEGSGLKWSDAYKSFLEPILKDYNKNKSHKAIAAALREDNSELAIGLAWSAQSRAAAAQVAMQYCNQDRTNRGIEPPCEIVVNNETVLPLGKAVLGNIAETDPSNVWLVESDTTSLYLIGSIHVLKPTMFPLPWVYDDAYAKADQIAAELNILLMTDPQRQAALQNLALTDEKAQKKNMPRDTKRALKRFVKSQGATIDPFYRLLPIITATQIDLLTTAALGYTGNAGFETHYARRASADGKPIIELEDPVEAMSVLTNLPMDIQYAALSDTLNNIEGSAEVYAQTLQLWIQSDAEALYDFSVGLLRRVPELQGFERAFLDDRNHTMATSLLPLLKSDKVTTAMVGAAHLGGEQGILNLLRAQGYQPVQLNMAGQPYRAEP